MKKILITLMTLSALFAFTACNNDVVNNHANDTNNPNDINNQQALDNIIVINGAEVPAEGGLVETIVEMAKNKNIREDSFRFLLQNGNQILKSYRAYAVSDDTTTTLISPIYYEPTSSLSVTNFKIRIVYIKSDDIRTLGFVNVKQLGK